MFEVSLRGDKDGSLYYQLESGGGELRVQDHPDLMHRLTEVCRDYFRRHQWNSRSAEEKTAALRHLQPMLEGIGVRHLWLFGSTLRESHSGSDLDIAVRLISPEDHENYFSTLWTIKERLEQELDFPDVDLVDADRLKPGIREVVEESGNKVF